MDFLSSKWVLHDVAKPSRTATNSTAQVFRGQRADRYRDSVRPNQFIGIVNRDYNRESCYDMVKD